MFSRPASAAPADQVVGNGTPLSCDEGAFKAAAAAGGTVTFDCGGPRTIQLTTPAPISQATTIDGGSVIRLTGNLAAQLFSVGVGINLFLKNIVLDKGYANHNAGGAIVNAGNLSFDNVTIQNSVADEQGGAIWTSGPVSIRNSSLKSNSAKSGGAITVQNPVAVTIDNASLTLNTAQDSTNGLGGAIQLGAGAQLTVTGGRLNSNLAAVEGGALDMAAGASAVFVPGSAGGTSISFNHAQAYGGAISNNGGLLSILGADLEYNQVLSGTPSIGYGGAIDDEGSLVMHDSRIANNLGRFGGGVFVGGTLFNASAVFTRTRFFANNAAVYGGGLYTNIATTTVTIAKSSFEYNLAGAGGGLTRTNAHLNISRSSFTNNQAQFGGGMFLQGLPDPTDGGYVEIRDATISSNLATNHHSGGIDNSALLDLRNVTIKDNHYGLWNSNGSKGATARLQSTVLDNAGGANCDGDGTLPASGGYNYSTDNSCALSGFQDTQGVGLNAELGPLTAGLFVITQFHVPLAGSPLINNGGPGCSITDQRGALRPDACDIGAVEFGGLLPRMYIPLVRR